MNCNSSLFLLRGNLLNCDCKWIDPHSHLPHTHSRYTGRACVYMSVWCVPIGMSLFRTRKLVWWWLYWIYCSRYSCKVYLLSVGGGVLEQPRLFVVCSLRAVRVFVRLFVCWAPVCTIENALWPITSRLRYIQSWKIDDDYMMTTTQAIVSKNCLWTRSMHILLHTHLLLLPSSSSSAHQTFSHAYAQRTLENKKNKSRRRRSKRNNHK